MPAEVLAGTKAFLFIARYRLMTEDPRFMNSVRCTRALACAFGLPFEASRTFFNDFSTADNWLERSFDISFPFFPSHLRVKHPLR